jgi:hypothetical protein
MTGVPDNSMIGECKVQMCKSSHDPSHPFPDSPDRSQFRQVFWFLCLLSRVLCHVRNARPLRIIKAFDTKRLFEKRGSLVKSKSI